ncbi:hypothetical protein KM043_012631 [Ampulex compressa]|nr:hypothetical protein KM043_012631 [Ampulex compressa]
MGIIPGPGTPDSGVPSSVISRQPRKLALTKTAPCADYQFSTRHFLSRTVPGWKEDTCWRWGRGQREDSSMRARDRGEVIEKERETRWEVATDFTMGLGNFP